MQASRRRPVLVLLAPARDLARETTSKAPPHTAHSTQRLTIGVQSGYGMALRCCSTAAKTEQSRSLELVVADCCRPSVRDWSGDRGCGFVGPILPVSELIPQSSAVGRAQPNDFAAGLACGGLRGDAV